MGYGSRYVELRKGVSDSSFEARNESTLLASYADRLGEDYYSLVILILILILILFPIRN